MPRGLSGGVGWRSDCGLVYRRVYRKQCPKRFISRCAFRIKTSEVKLSTHFAWSVSISFCTEQMCWGLATREVCSSKQRHGKSRDTQACTNRCSQTLTSSYSSADEPKQHGLRCSFFRTNWAAGRGSFRGQSFDNLGRGTPWRNNP